MIIAEYQRVPVEVGGSKLSETSETDYQSTQHHTQMMIFFINNIMKDTNHICILNYGIILSPACFTLFSFLKLVFSDVRPCHVAGRHEICGGSSCIHIQR